MLFIIFYIHFSFPLRVKVKEKLKKRERKKERWKGGKEEIEMKKIWQIERKKKRHATDKKPGVQMFT